MSNVTVSIAGRSYTVACDVGQEAHIVSLASSIDAKLQAIPNLNGQAESRVLLFAALLLADELHESQSGKAPVAPSMDSRTAGALEDLAQKLESVAEHLESLGHNA